MDEICICAAILLIDGRIIRCHRHADGLRTASALVDWEHPGSWEATHRNSHQQGFVTSRNRYVGRTEGLRLQKAAGIPSVARDGYRHVHLFSEDLY